MDFIEKWFEPSFGAFTVGIKECNYLAFWQLCPYDIKSCESEMSH